MKKIPPVPLSRSLRTVQTLGAFHQVYTFKIRPDVCCSCATGDKALLRLTEELDKVKLDAPVMDVASCPVCFNITGVPSAQALLADM